MKLVRVDYEDITQRDEDSLTGELTPPALISEFGLLLEKDDLYIHIIKTYNHEEDFSYEICTIPIGCVKRVEVIREEGLY